MKNRQKFQRSQLVRLKGQPESPPMTITKILRMQDDNEAPEKVINFTYQCSLWNAKRNRFDKLDLDENTLEKVKEVPKDS